MRSICHSLFVVLWLGLFASTGASAQGTMPRSVLGSGATSATGTGITMRATLGQPAIGTVGGPIVLQQGFWFAMPTAPAPTSVSDRSVEARATLQLFPNPVSTSAVMSIELDRPGHLQAILFDGLGRPVVTLVDEDRPSGATRLGLDAADLPSGSYMLRVKTTSGFQTLPVAIVR